MRTQSTYPANKGAERERGRFTRWVLGLSPLIVSLFFYSTISTGWAFERGQSDALRGAPDSAPAVSRSIAGTHVQCGDAAGVESSFGLCENAPAAYREAQAGPEAQEAQAMASQAESSPSAEGTPAGAPADRVEERVLAVQPATTRASEGSPSPEPSFSQAPSQSESPAASAVEERTVEEEAVSQAAPAAVEETPPTSTPPALRIALSSLEANMFQAINQRRTAAGLPPLEIDPVLTAAARDRSQDMVSKGYFSHTAPDGTTFITVLANYGVVTGTVGEILGRNNASDDLSATMVADAFMKSPSHQLHVVYPAYQWVGIGAVKGSDNMKYFTVLFRGP